MKTILKILAALIVLYLVGSVATFIFIQYQFAVSDSVGAREYEVLEKALGDKFDKAMKIEKALHNYKHFFNTTFAAFVVTVDEPGLRKLLADERIKKIKVNEIYARPQMRLVKLLEMDYSDFMLMYENKEAYRLGNRAEFIVDQQAGRKLLYIYIDPRDLKRLGQSF